MVVKKKKSAPVKKVAARNVTKKSVKKNPVAKKSAPRIKPSRATLDSLVVPEVPISRSFKNINDAIEKTSRGASLTHELPPVAPINLKTSSKSKYIAIVTAFLILGLGSYLLSKK